MVDKQENILIGYTKWLFKWAAILCVVSGVVIGGWVGYENYQDQLVPVIAIKCETKPSPRYYLIQKRRDEASPYALYRPAYYNKVITKETSADDYWRQYKYQGNKDWWDEENKKMFTGSRFATASWENREGAEDTEHWIIRETLQVIFWSKDSEDKWQQSKVGECSEIPFSDFHEKSKRGLKERKDELKF